MSIYRIKRTDEEITKLLDAVGEQMDSEGTKFRGMCYEEGIQEALMWLFGEQDEHPYGFGDE